MYGMAESAVWPVQVVHCLYPVPLSSDYIDQSALVLTHHQQIGTEATTDDHGSCNMGDEYLPAMQCAATTSDKLARGRRERGGRGRRRTRKGNPSRLEGVTADMPAARGNGDNTSDDLKCHQLMKELSAKGRAIRVALSAIRGKVVQLAFDPVGCRVVQQALQVADKEASIAMIAELKGSVIKASGCPYANFVLQKVIELLPPSQAEFIVNELCCRVSDVAINRYGCRIICRLLEHSAAALPTGTLLDKMLINARILCYHTYGHYVIQMLLEHGTCRHRKAVVAALCKDAVKMAKSRHSSHIMILVLTANDADDRHALIEALLAKDNQIPELAEDKHGWLVIRAMCKVAGTQLQNIRTRLAPGVEQLQESKYGKRILQECGTGLRAFGNGHANASGLHRKAEIVQFCE